MSRPVSGQGQAEQVIEVTETRLIIKTIQALFIVLLNGTKLMKQTMYLEHQRMSL